MSWSFSDGTISLVKGATLMFALLMLFIHVWSPRHWYSAYFLNEQPKWNGHHYLTPVISCAIQYFYLNECHLLCETLWSTCMFTCAPKMSWYYKLTCVTMWPDLEEKLIKAAKYILNLPASWAFPSCLGPPRWAPGPEQKSKGWHKLKNKLPVWTVSSTMFNFSEIKVG